MKIGYALLLIGILIILGSALNLLLIFQGSLDPIQYYSPDDINFDLSSLVPSPTIPAIPGLEQPITMQSPQSPIDPAVMAESFNLLIHLFILGFMVNVGYKIASVGTQMIRPIVVKVRKSEQVIAPRNKSQPPTPAQI